MTSAGKCTFRDFSGERNNNNNNNKKKNNRKYKTWRLKQKCKTRSNCELTRN